jgi:hypothetical protein
LVLDDPQQRAEEQVLLHWFGPLIEQRAAQAGEVVVGE